ncbi:neuferricin isoform X2 [Pogoniulus pusillus]|uniref:neuferricin isoform X2 n=1 Tax=Pogoniulus pusillus TaxID=488313 RepID=UPI0030B94301
MGAGVAAALLCLGAAWLLGAGVGPRGWMVRPSARSRLLSVAELARFRGAAGEPGLYLAVLGRVFDVERGRRHYGPGGAYSGLAGRDATRAFATGDFTQAGLVDDVSALSSGEMLAIQSWLTFYSDNYDPVELFAFLAWKHCSLIDPPLPGKLVGRFYDENGAPTEALRQAEAAIEEALKFQAESEQRKQQFPPCNSEWSSAKGSRFWCSRQRNSVSKTKSSSVTPESKPGSSSETQDSLSLAPPAALNFAYPPGAQATLQTLPQLGTTA